ncbi:uncharacterized protein LOC143451853 [Clavelina lepadiformis]|uniref:uncharacterized protein LOC143451853 n=1 Tax=Clavelina lepadiformis TaxID=159417 RepID=UPI0040413AC0
MSLMGLESFEASEFFTRKLECFGRKDITVTQFCEHEVLGRVIVKVSPRKLFGSRDNLLKDENKSFKRMLRHVLKLQMMNHKNITKFYGVTKWPGFAGIITECTECGSLMNLLRSKDLVPDIPWWLRQRILTEVFEALQYLHNQPTPIVHGRVTTRNILLAKDLTVKLIEISGSHVAIGDRYASIRCFLLKLLSTPEDEKLVDIYSASQVAYEMITRCVLTPMEFGFLTSLGEPITMLNNRGLEDELCSNTSDSYIFNLLKNVALKCGSVNKYDRPDADTVLEMLDKGKNHFYGEKKSNEACDIAEKINLYNVQLVTEREPLDVVFKLKLHGNEEEWTLTHMKNSADACGEMGISPVTPFSVRPPRKSEQNNPRLYPFLKTDNSDLVFPGEKTSPQSKTKEFHVGITDFVEDTVDSSLLSYDGQQLYKQFAEKTSDMEKPLNTFKGKHPDHTGDSNLVNTSIQRCWSLPVEIRFVYETCAIVGYRGGTINVCDCKINIPQGASPETFEFKFMLLYGREHVENSDVQVLTPTLSCLPTQNFLKPVTVELPTCYDLNKPVGVTPQESINGKLWDDLRKTKHVCRDSILFQTMSLSWHRVVNKVPDLIGSFKKTLVYLCYRHPSNCSGPYVTLELRDNVMNHLFSLGETEGFRGVVEVRSKDDLVLKFSNPNTTIQPDEKIVMSKDIFEQGFLLQQNFRILNKDEQLKYDHSLFKFEIKTVTDDKLILARNFQFPNTIGEDRLTEITLSHCTIPNVSAPACGTRGDLVPRDPNKSERTEH